MRPIEAAWLKDRLEVMEVAELSPLLEVGSSSLAFRTINKPHIEKLVHAPLRERGVRIVTTDLRDADGVDIVGDLFDDTVRKKLIEVNARSLLMCNLFEHLSAPAEFAAACKAFVQSGGYIIVTVPYDYPYHLDPIDTMFRPTPEEIHLLFPGTQLIEGRVLVDGGLWSDLRQKKSRLNSVVAILGDIVRLVALRGGRERAKSRASRLRYLFKNYKISAAIMLVDEN